MRKLLWTFLQMSVLLLVLFIGGCGGGSASAPPPSNPAVPIPAAPISVSITPSAVQSVDEGQTVNLTATVASDSSNKGVTWTVSCSTGPCGTVSPTATASGAPTTYTAPGSVSANLSVTVTATSVADSTKSAPSSVTVMALSVTVAPTAVQTVDQGQTVNFTASVVNDSSNKGVTWTVSCSTAPCGTVSPTSTASGAATTYTAPGSVSANPSVTVTATSVVDSTKSAPGSITVMVLSVSVSPSTLQTVNPGQSMNFTATVANDSSNKGVAWTVSCSSMPCGSVSPTSTPSGTPTTYTPPVALPASNLSVKLTATSVADSTKFNSASLTIPQLPGFAGVSEAHVDSVNGMTRLIINGKPAPPLLFMDQEDFLERLQFLAPQVQDAAASGIHLFEISLNNWPWDNQGIAPLDFTAADQELDNVIKADPKAALVLKVGVWPGPGWKPPVAPTTADYILYPDGQTSDSYHLSTASDIFFNGFLTSVPHLLQHYENSSYAAHLLGYIINAGGTGEWYPVDIWRGPDYSPVNTKAFQTWLQNKYGTDAALSAAWGMPVTISGAQVPPPQPGRFPMHSVAGSSSPINAFYQLPQEQDWVDYSAYISDLFSQRILDAVKLVRAQTGGKRLIGINNGYLMDGPSSFFAHDRVDRLLASPDIDFFAAALTSLDRLAGAAGGMDVTIDSFIAHGKLWFNENDLFTYLSANSIFPPLGSSNPPTANLTETVDVLDRELASVLIHRAGTWWMDISENGAFNDPAIWAPMSDHGIPLFNQLYANPQPYKSDVALIIDRNSILYEKNDEDAPLSQRAMLRYALAKTGVAYGLYTLDDFLDGTAPRNKVYIFANAFYLTDVQISTIQLRLNTEGATAIWQYAPGFLGPNGVDVTRASKLTGIQLTQSDGFGYTNGAGVMAGFNWGFTSQNLLSPRLVVTDLNAEVLGRYQSDNLVSSARNKVGNFESIFSGEFALGPSFVYANAASPSPDVLRALLQTTGVHIWSTAGDVVFTDGSLLVIHAAAAGTRSISLPAGVTATPLGGGLSSTVTLNVTFSRVGETLWFRLS